MKKLLLSIVLFTAFLVGYGAAGQAWPGVPDRSEYRGYFTNVRDTSGTHVFPNEYNGNAFPARINTANEFISFVRGKLSGNSQERTGASFLIQTMIGLGRSRPPTAAQIAEWERRVRYAEARGWITWRTNFSYTINSFYQGPRGGGSPNDDAFFYERGTRPSMVFRNASGTVVYAIKWECANPLGNVRGLQDDLSFSMSGRTAITANPTPRPGESVTFAHYVRNNGPTATTPTAISWTTWNSLTGARTGGPTSSGTYSAGQEKLVRNEVVPVPVDTPAGTQICRQVGYDPTNGTGGRNGRGPAVCATVRYDYGLTPIVNVQINGGATPGSTAEEGDNITFNYIVQNNGSTQSRPTTCVTSGRTYTGYEGAPGGLTPVAVGAACNEFPRNSSTTVASETFPAVANTTVCRQLSVTPSTHATPPVTATSTIVCAYVANKPYVKIFGGDIAAGGGLQSSGGSCSTEDATIMGWSKRNDASNAWAGAGSQYAAFAYRALNDFATTQLSGGAAAPSGLAFANSGITNANRNSGTYGGAWGAASCIPDYYASKPDSASSLGTSVNLAPLGTGAYETSGDTTINGTNFGPGKRVSLFVDGDAYITDNIVYAGNWNSGSVPLFELVVRGNLFISPNVTQLDGAYIAQQDGGGAGGYLYTCTNTASPFSALPLDGQLYDRCSSRLTVNGAAIANRIYLLRTIGTLRQSTVNEGRSTSNAGEIFNYNPAIWIAQPTGIIKAVPDEYDSITSLPPIL